ncbi:MAG: sugar ABC transporter permease [Lachnospiraceae bacterium]|nr:sugar ABC transporter permease [Lachnospiraceae bacterium]
MGKISQAVRKHFSLYPQALLHGDIFTRLAFIIFGAGNLFRGQIVKGLVFLLLEIGFIFYMVTLGVEAVRGFITLGTVEQGWVFDERKGIEVMTAGDNSMLLLLYGIISLIIIVCFVVIWRMNIRSAYDTQKMVEKGQKVPQLRDEIGILMDKKAHITLLLLPVMGIFIFTVLPLIYMILVAFTNYDSTHQPPGKLFDWVGFQNFTTLLRSDSPLGASFWPILGWTLIWAVVATVTCFLAGIILALWINSKIVKGKKFWRTMFVFSVAVPQFVSLLVMKTMLQPEGALNVLLRNTGVIDGSLPFLTNATWARVTVIVINLWLGAPYTMLISTGILMNIPTELYEAAQIDGANAATIFRKITLPYIMFVMTPSLITQFIGNVNNFNVIFLLTGGGPSTLEYYQAGKTDLLVTWLYKLTTGSKDYSYASVIGILVFIISAVISLLTYRQTPSYNNEEGFQ